MGARLHAAHRPQVASRWEQVSRLPTSLRPNATPSVWGPHFVCLSSVHGHGCSHLRAAVPGAAVGVGRGECLRSTPARAASGHTPCLTWLPALSPGISREGAAALAPVTPHGVKDVGPCQSAWGRPSCPHFLLCTDRPAPLHRGLGRWGSAFRVPACWCHLSVLLGRGGCSSPTPDSPAGLLRAVRSALTGEVLSLPRVHPLCSSDHGSSRRLSSMLPPSALVPGPHVACSPSGRQVLCVQISCSPSRVSRPPGPASGRGRSQGPAVSAPVALSCTLRSRHLLPGTREPASGGPGPRCRRLPQLQEWGGPSDMKNSQGPPRLF